MVSSVSFFWVAVATLSSSACLAYLDFDPGFLGWLAVITLIIASICAGIYQELKNEPKGEDL